MIKNRKRLWALFLSAALIVTQLPAVAMAENNVPEDGSIASFEPLDIGVANQTVDVGTELSALALPDTVAANIYQVTEDTVIPDEDNIEDDSGDTSTATPSDADKSVSDNHAGDTSVKDSGKTVTTIITSEEQIPVSWDCEPVYDGETEGSYVFTADVGGYVLSDDVKLLKITVTVGAESVEKPTESQPGETLPCTQTEGCTLPDGHEGDCVPAPPANDGLIKTITNWTFVATDYSDYAGNELALSGVNMEQQADYDTVVSMLPTQLSAEIENEADLAALDITSWTCPEYIPDGEGNWPLTGDYTFTAALANGYAYDPLPTVKVLLGGADTYAIDNTLTEGGLTVKASNNGEVEYNVGSGFTLKANGTYEISGTWIGNVDQNKAVITVPSGVTANVTLNTAAINVSGQICGAFAVAAGGTANITLSGTNALTSGHSRAGLEVPKDASVTIAGNGSLTATGGISAAGIGGGNSSQGINPNAGSITISGGVEVTAQGGDHAAGIGGGAVGDGGHIIISGGIVSATGGNSDMGDGGAGIGGSALGDGGTIAISGDAEVTAQGGDYAAGIGGGAVGDGGHIIISGGTVTAIGSGGNSSLGGGAGIGGGRTYSGKGNGGIIEISGGKVSATGGGSGAGIGGGSGAGISDGGSGGHITISGGIVEAVGSEDGAGIGGGGSTNQANGGEAGTIEINGDTVVFATAPGIGAHIGSGGNYYEEGTNSGSFIEGVVFEGVQGTVHGSPELPGNVTIPNGSTLTVPDGATLTIPDGTTLTNNGTIENNGTIRGGGSITNNGTVNDHSGGITVTVSGTEANKPSEAGISFRNSQDGQITQAAYGDTIKITATAQRKATNTLARGAALNKVDFYIGTISSERHIGTADVAIDNSTATAILEITLTDKTWKKGFAIGENTIVADFGDMDTLKLLGSTGKANLTVKASPDLSLEAAPAGSQTLPGNVTLTATLSDAYPDNAGKTIIFTVNGIQHGTAITNDSGVATYSIANPSQGGYTFDASFAGDTLNTQATAAQISGYAVGLGTQAALGITGLDSAYTYGCDAFSLSTSGGSGSGAVSYESSEPSIASVTGSTVTIQKAGTFTITATKASDSHYAEAKVTSHVVTVHSATPNMSLTASGGSTTSAPLTLTATVSKVGNGATPAGTVTFKVGDKTLHSDSLDGDGNAVYTISNPEAGSHVYTVEYSGQTGYYNKTSTARTIGVGLTDQTGFTITNPGDKTYGDGNFTLMASGGQSTGSVSFSVTSSNGVLAVAADGSVKITGAGKVMVTAMKDGDSKYNQATATLEITVKPRDISNVTVNVMGSHVYTGSQLQPSFEVYDSGNAITTGDYTNSYGTNVAVGTGAGSITLTGQRNYTGTKTVLFDIEKRSLNSAVITLEASSYPYTGSEIKPAVTNVAVDGITVPAAEYDVGYSANKDAGTATVTITAKADGNFSGSASTTFTITKADTPSGNGSTGGGDSSGGGGSYSEPEPQGSYTVAGDKISRTISRSDIKKLADFGKSLTLRCGKASMTFNPAALKAILEAVPAAAGNITFSAAPSDLSAFLDAAKLIGNRPVYDFTISYKDSKGNPVVVPVNFPAGSASISLNYTPAVAEVTGSLFMVYVNGAGAVTWLDKSSYDNGKVLAEVPHFSTYGVAYKTPAPVFTDITSHWAKADMEFVAARGLLSGTGNNLFSPDGAMTRGMFVTALGRLAGVNPDSYQTRSFSDVKADAYYAAYVEWAAQKNIVKGTGEGLFSPDTPVTREQMAVMMTNYAGQMGYSIPTPLAAVTFADNANISAWAAKEVAAMQRAGIIKGKDGNRFDSQASATRAEVSAVLRRFVEIVIDPATAQGWGKNDSGQWLYYKDGKALTGWKQIGSKWYYFDKNGIMAVNTKVDGYEIGPDGARKDNN